MTDPAEAASAVRAARDRVLEFVGLCSEQQWGSTPLGDEDPRSVGVILDHVADAYVYLGRWIRALVDGATVEVTPKVVDGLNAEHTAARGGGIVRDAVCRHLLRQGDDFAELVAGLREDQFTTGDGAIRRFAEIAARHADTHRTELESALGITG